MLGTVFRSSLRPTAMNVRQLLPILLLGISWNLFGDDRFDGPGPGYRTMAAPQVGLKPLDGMPVIGDQTPEIMRRLKELENRLSKLEKPQRDAAVPESRKSNGTPKDGGDIFVHAYLIFQEGERALGQKEYGAAVAKLQEADDILADLQKSQPNWQPNIVDYRRGRIAARIADAKAALKEEQDSSAAKQGAEKP